MSLPKPEVGLVISYSYLWRYEHEAGRDEGGKNRPCVIVLAVRKEDDKQVVTVSPITHTKPKDDETAVEIPLAVKKHLGLDDERSWIMVNEVNEFTWPGYDIRKIAGSEDKYAYGFLPPKLFERVKSKIIDLIIKKRTKITLRD